MNYYSDENPMAAPQPCRRRKAAGWRAFLKPEIGFVGFVGFVKKNECVQHNRKITIFAKILPVL